MEEQVVGCCKSHCGHKSALWGMSGGERMGLGNLVEVAEWGGDSEPVTTEVTSQVHMGLGSIKMETETNYRPVKLCLGRLEGAVFSCVPQ